MSKYTAERVRERLQEMHGHALTVAERAELFGIASDYAALLRERESAKAGVTDEIAERVLNQYVKNCLPHLDEAPVSLRIEAMRAALEAVALMLASARVPVEKENLDPVKLRRQGRVATEWEQGFNEGWNACRDAMLAAAPKPETEE